MIETFFLISKKMTSTNMYDRGKNFRKLRSIWDNEPGNGKISKILSGVKKSAESHEENELFFSKSIISLLWHKKWQSDMLVIWKYSFALHVIGQENHKRTSYADIQSYEAWENFKYVLKIGDKKFTWYAISLNSGQTLVFYVFICKIPFSFSKWKIFQDI